MSAQLPKCGIGKLPLLLLDRELPESSIESNREAAKCESLFVNNNLIALMVAAVFTAACP